MLSCRMVATQEADESQETVMQFRKREQHPPKSFELEDCYLLLSCKLFHTCTVKTSVLHARRSSQQQQQMLCKTAKTLGTSKHTLQAGQKCEVSRQFNSRSSAALNKMLGRGDPGAYGSLAPFLSLWRNRFYNRNTNF